MKIALIGNTDFAIYNYRFELCQALLIRGHEVVVICPLGNYVKRMVDSGCKHIEISVNAHGLNPLQDLKLKRSLQKILKQEKPDYVCGYTIKPNIYGAWACKKLKIPFIANITGLGPKVENKGLIQLITVFLYKIAFSKIYVVFCQNEANKLFFEKHNIAKGKIELIPGSGVNLAKFKLEPYPKTTIIKFAFVGRVRKEKGIDQFVEAARQIKKDYQNVEFHVFGKCDSEYEWISTDTSIIYHGMIDDTSAVYKNIHCLIFPSFYAEGLANVLLEASASGRPVITTNRAGCKETLINNVTGFIIEEQNTIDLINKIKMFLDKSEYEKAQMGIEAHKYVESNFDRNIIIHNYFSVFGM